MIVYRSRKCIASNSVPALTIAGSGLQESGYLGKLEVTFDSKMSFENNLLSISRAASQRLVILRKSWHVFNDRFLVERCFRCFVLPVLECCPALCCSVADSYL